MGFRQLCAVGAALALAGCGVIYTSPGVSDGQPFGAAYSTDFDVKVVTLTHESARSANLEPYMPPRLPLAYQPGEAAKTLRRAGGVPALAPLPQTSARPSARPGFVADNFPPITDPAPYRIGVADVLLLSVNTSTTLDDLPGLISAQAKRQGYVVQDDGAIAVPDAGRVQVAGLTLQDAEAEIFRALVASGIDPSFSLEIAEFNSQRVSVGGDVAQPQLVPVTLKPLYLHEAIQASGGIEGIDTRVGRVQLFRGGQIYQIGLERFLADPAARRIVLRDGDSVYVGSEFQQEQAARFFEEQLALRDQQMRTAQFAFQAEQLRLQSESNAQTILQAERELFEKRLELGAVARPHAYVAGEVRRTVRVPLPFEQRATLADVLFDEKVNGLDIQTADYGEIYVLRAETDPALAGGLTAYHLDAENAVNLAVAARFEMQPNDVVFIAEQPVTAWNRVISQILPQIFLSAANLANAN